MAQTLETLIVINATIGNGFAEVGNTLSQLGSLVNGLSQKLIDFGKDSLDVYKDFEKAMAESEVALSTGLGRDSNKLQNTMRNLKDQAAEWAKESIFHTNDVAEAISDAAHAGWDEKQILEGMPAAMQLAQAGGLGLAESVDYLTKTMNGLELPMENAGKLVDEWVFSANSSAGSVREFGDTFTKLGATMQFADNIEEVMALTAGFHQMGATGSEAATLLRNFMMNLYAPSGVASKTMELLGATDDEINAIRDDASKLETINMLEAAGFSAFDKYGEAKPVIDLVHDLRDTLGEIAGGYDKITSNQTTMGILSTLFGKRGVTAATDAMKALNLIDEVYGRLMNGEAVGYGEYAQRIMNDTLFGSIEHFASQWEELQRKTGNVLSDQVRPFLETAGGFVDKISGMDDAAFSGLVGALEPLAVAGPGLLLAGSAMRGIGSAMKIWTSGPVMQGVAGVALAAAAVASLTTAVDQMQQANFEEKFGTMGLDNEALRTFAQGIQTDYNNATQSIGEFETALTEVVENYKTATSDLKSSLITDMITGAELTPGTPEYEKLIGLGETAAQAVKDGLQLNYGEQRAYLDSIFGDDAKGSDAYSTIIDSINRNLENAVQNTEEIAGKFKSALQDMLSDGAIDPGELDSLRDYMNDLNEIMAQQAEAQAYVNQQEALAKAQGLGLENMQESMELLKNANDEMLLTQMHRAWDNDANLIQGLKKDLEGGLIDQTQYDTAVSEIQAASRDYMLGLSRDLNKGIVDVANQAFRDSDLNDAWQAMYTLGADIQSTGGLLTQAASERFASGVGNDLSDVWNGLQMVVNSLGGIDNMQEYADYLDGKGETSYARQLQQLANSYSALSMAGGMNPGVGTYVPGNYENVIGTPEQMQAIVEGSGFTMDNLADFIQNERDLDGQMDQGDWTRAVGQELYDQLNGVAQQMGTTLTDAVAQATGLQSQAQYETEQQINALNAQNESLRSQVDDIQQNGLWEYMGTGKYQLPDAEANAAMERLNAEIAANESKIAELQSGGGAMEEPTGLSGFLSSLLENLTAPFSAQAEEMSLPAELQADTTSTEGLIPDEAVKIPAELEPAATSMEELVPTEPVQIPAELTTEGAAPEDLTGGNAVQVPVDGDTAALNAAIMGEDSQNLMAYVDGDTSALNAAIWAEDGQTIITYVDGDVSALAAAISSQDGRSITVHVNYVSHGAPKGYATGGRATEPSIFGEAGPEWAIPEQHTEQTAALLNAAREASGFTWPDLLSRFGGLNANPNNTPSTLVYSPTINAQDVSGVEEALLDDKRRLEKWFEERQLREDMEVYT